MSAFAVEPWTNFFLATASAAAALTELLFVSISINLSQITRYAALPGRAIEAIMILVTALAESLVTLIPGQPAALLGIEILVVALAASGSITAIQLRARGILDRKYRATFVGRVVLAQAAILPFVLAGLTLLIQGGVVGFTGWSPGRSSPSASASPAPGSSW